MEGMGSPGARIVLSPDEGERVEFGGLGARFMVEEAQSGGTFALVEHPIGPRVLAAPLPPPSTMMVAPPIEDTLP